MDDDAGRSGGGQGDAGLDDVGLAARFEEERGRLRAVAYRMLGSVAEADDALQEAWLRASAAGTEGVANLSGWLTTVVSRVCLNTLRTRRTRREDLFDEPPGSFAPEGSAGGDGTGDPEEEALLADSVGVALLVVLDRLSPAERLAFVLHDMFAVPFEDIGPMLERTPVSARQLASRARRRVKGAGTPPGPDQVRRRQVVDAFLSATRRGDFEALVGLLHPDVVLRADAAVVPTPEPVVVLGAHTVAKGAMAAVGRARFTGPVRIDGAVGLAMARHGRPAVALAFTIVEGLITEIDVVAEPERLRALDLTVPDGH
ncbi:sigma-70 family RNA polymerase sigma factor [Streptomyces sp. NPDC048338]|uniref:sigma-70 family RNA polymerase sigma factor n=1 Tax=Streptomyces sp. NPDC048338 TaxID=3365536 RepID=UPI0037126C12